MTWVWCFALCGVLALGFWLQGRDRRSFKAVLEAVRRKHGGVLKPGSILGFAALEVTVGPGTFLLSALPNTGSGADGSSSEGVSYVTFDLGDHQAPDCSLRSCDSSQAFAKLDRVLATKRIEVGDPAFDRLFLVAGDDQVAIRKFLDPALRQLLVQRFKKNQRFSIGAGKLRVSEDGVATQPEEFDHLIDLARLLQERIRNFSQAQST